MGYFRRKLDRGRALEQAREASSAGVDAAVRRVWERIPDAPLRSRCYLRFATRATNAISSRRTGIFAAAYDVLASPDLDAPVREPIRDALAWFERNLPVPRSVDDNRVLFLFKSDAGACMRRIWRLVSALGEAGVHVEMQRFDRPGRILYQDRWQIAILPWSETRGL